MKTYASLFGRRKNRRTWAAGRLCRSVWRTCCPTVVARDMSDALRQRVPRRVPTASTRKSRLSWWLTRCQSLLTRWSQSRVHQVEQTTGSVRSGLRVFAVLCVSSGGENSLSLEMTRDLFCGFPAYKRRKFRNPSLRNPLNRTEVTQQPSFALVANTRNRRQL